MPVITPRLTGAGPTGTYVSGVRELNVPLARGSFELAAGDTITMRMFYRSVEDGTYGDVVPMPASSSDGEGGTIPGASQSMAPGCCRTQGRV